jgi:hypothetical protein
MEYLKFAPSDIESTKDIRAGWRRELWEWMVVMAGLTLGMWIILTAAQLIAELAFRLVTPNG